MKIRAIAACAVLTLTAAPAAHADPNVVIKALGYAGSGCKAGSAAVSAASDWTALTLAFDSFVASAGPGIKLTESHKNCTMKITLRLPRKAMHVAVHTAEYQGYVNVDASVTAMLKSTVYTPRTTEERTDFAATWTGPVDEEYAVADDAEPVFSTNPGDTVTLLIDSFARVDNSKNKKGSGFLTTGAINHKTTIVLGLQWRG